MLLSGPAVGLSVRKLAQRAEYTQSRMKFDDHLNKQVFLFEKETRAFVEILYGLRALFLSSELVTREEFTSFTEHSLARYSDIRALEWAPIISDAERADFEQSARIDGLADFVITSQMDNGTIGPAPPGGIYYPVYYLEPLEGNSAAIGYDLGSEPTRRRALLASANTEDPVISDPIRLVQRDGTGSSLLIFLRVQRDGRNLGFVLLVLDLNTVVESTLLAPEYLDAEDYEFTLIDMDVNGRESIMFSHGNGKQVAPDGDMTVTITLEIGGQSWCLIARPSVSFLARVPVINANLAGAGASAAWVLIWTSVIAITNWSRRIFAERQKRLLDAVMLSMSEGLIVADTGGKVILQNQAAALVLGIDLVSPTNGLSTLSGRCRLPDKTTPFPEKDFPLTRAIDGQQVRDQIMWAPPANPSVDGAWLSVNAAPLMGSDGSHRGGILVLHDITQRKQFLEFSHRMANAVELTDDSVFITDKSGIIEYVNPAFERTTGYAREEALGATPRILKSDLNPPEHYADLWSTILEGNVFRKVIINRKKSGEIYHADQTITPMHNLNGEISHFVSVVKDLTDYRQLRQHEVEMEVAAGVQLRLYPSSPPRMAQIDVAGAVFSADATCGDYFDYIPIADGSIGLAVGDVSGHGIGPALVMAETRAYLRPLPPAGHSPGEVLTKVNCNLFGDLEHGRFVTLLLAYVDANSGSLVYSSAGHDTCYQIDAKGRISQELTSTGLPLGVTESSTYDTRGPFPIALDDILVLLTDGLGDCLAHLDRFLDVKDCLSLIHRHRHEPAAKIVERVRTHVLDFLGEESQNDDITLIICKIDSLK
jgi:PAS domain S-box-containing protein